MNRVQGEYFDPRWRKEQKAGEKNPIRGFIICTLHRISLGKWNKGEYNG
jgi:hypothetical protein